MLGHGRVTFISCAPQGRFLTLPFYVFLLVPCLFSRTFLVPESFFLVLTGMGVMRGIICICYPPQPLETSESVKFIKLIDVGSQVSATVFFRLSSFCCVHIRLFVEAFYCRDCLACCSPALRQPTILLIFRASLRLRRAFDCFHFAFSVLPLPVAPITFLLALLLGATNVVLRNVLLLFKEQRTSHGLALKDICVEL